MFSTLTNKLNSIIKNIKGTGRLTEDNIKSSILEIRKVLIDADVALQVVNSFIDSVKSQAIGTEINTSLNPGQVFTKLIHQELKKALGDNTQDLILKAQPPIVILLAGLQGSGKTTSAAKLAQYISTNYKKKIMLTSTDVYRPAALLQLKTLAEQINVNHYIPEPDHKPQDIAKAALEKAKKTIVDVLIVDTAGRMHVDQELMQEIELLKSVLNPVETLFVVDSMTGQDAANTAKAFADTLPLTGVILSKTDGDNRGGAALSVSQITGKPIKFMGTGEKIPDFEKFHPDRIANRILDMGDILSLIESIEQKSEEKSRKKLTKKITKGKSFNFNDLREQLNQMNQMGGLKNIMKMMPGMQGVNQSTINAQNKGIAKNIAIINSMTIKERKYPKLLDSSRKKRIASGSGTEVADINLLVKQLNNMQKMMKKFTKGKNMSRLMQSFKGHN
ncbi:MAG: signal recognition particle protein [Legionellales bacterium]|nr:signal recognition particle protein [Legionellales bacterium]